MGSKFSLTPLALPRLVSRGVDYIDWPHTKIHIDCNPFMPKPHKKSNEPPKTCPKNQLNRILLPI